MLISPSFHNRKRTGSVTEFWLDDQGVFHLKALDKLITVDSIQHEYELIKDYLKNHPVKPPILYDATCLPPIDRASRKKLEVLLDECFSSLAVVSDSRIGKMVVNIFFSLSDQTVPKKIFSSKEEAYSWIGNSPVLSYGTF